MIKIPGVSLLDAATSEKSPENYGIYGHLTTGKTVLAGDLIRFYQEQGKDCIYVVTPGEDPYASLAQSGIGQCIVSVTTMSEFDSVIKAVTGKIGVIVLDSMKGLYRLSMDKSLGKNKYPVDNKDWSPVHDAFSSAVEAWKSAAPVSVFLCPADRSTDSFLSPGEKKPNLIACDLPGRMAAGIRGLVSYMGYVTADLNNESKTFTRKISFVPEKGILTLARGLARPMTEPIVLHEGFTGNWARIQKALEAHRVVA